MVTKWTAADLNALADLLLATTLAGLRGDISLTPETIAALKRLPALGSFACRVGPGSNLELLKELPRIRWLVLIGDATQPRAIPPVVWADIGARKLQALELNGISIDDEAAKRIAGLELIGEQLLSLIDCPGTHTRLNVLAKGTAHILSIGDKNLTDSDVPRLAAFKTLKELNFWSDGLTEPGVKSLSEKMPDCRITWKERTFGKAPKK
jgi:hypothetical protein